MTYNTIRDVKFNRNGQTLLSIKKYESEGGDITASDNYAIRAAVYHGLTDTVEYLLNDDRVDPSVEDNVCLLTAVKKRYTDIVRLLLNHKKVTPSSTHIKWAVSGYHVDILKMLLKDGRVNPAEDNLSALSSAMNNQYMDIFKILLKDKRILNGMGDNLGYFLDRAVTDRRYEYFDLLLKNFKYSMDELSPATITHIINKKIGKFKDFLNL